MVKAGTVTEEQPERITDDMDFPPGWRPNKGEKLLGTIVARDIGENEWGTYAILTFAVKEDSQLRVNVPGEDEGQLQDFAAGERIAWHAFHTVARNALRKLRPPVGKELEVTYRGTQLRRGVKPEKAKTGDYIHGWAVRDPSVVLTEDDFYGAVDEGKKNGNGDFNDEAPF